MILADIAPRLARARDGILRERVESRQRKEARIAEARERKRIRRETTAPTTTFCGKVRYPTRDEARRKKSKKSKRLRVYKCLACDGWHLTSKAHVRWAKAGDE